MPADVDTIDDDLVGRFRPLERPYRWRVSKTELGQRIEKSVGTTRAGAGAGSLLAWLFSRFLGEGLRPGLTALIGSRRRGKHCSVVRHRLRLNSAGKRKIAANTV